MTELITRDYLGEMPPHRLPPGIPPLEKASPSPSPHPDFPPGRVKMRSSAWGMNTIAVRAIVNESRWIVNSASHEALSGMERKVHTLRIAFICTNMNLVCLKTMDEHTNTPPGELNPC